MIILDNISKQYKKKMVVKNFSLNMENKVYSMLGANGSGKTTLVRIITNVIEPEHGSIIKQLTADEKEALSDKHKRKHKHCNHYSVGYLPQKFGTFKEFTVMEQMKYFANLKKIEIEQQDAAIMDVLEIVNLSDKINSRCATLSGGMVRRIGIAQAILGEPDMIIFDEPTTGLDPEERLRFKRILYKIKGRCPILIATHIVEDVEAVSDKIIIVKDGLKIKEDSVENIIAVANDRVYEIPVSKLDELTMPHIISRYFDNRNNEKMARVIFLEDAYENKLGHPVVSSVEDGYLYLSNQIS